MMTPAGKLKIGDRVVTPEGFMGVISDTMKMSHRRNGKGKKRYYYVESPLPGTPIVWWRAKQLTRYG